MTEKHALTPLHGPHAFPAYVVECIGFEFDHVIVHARNRDRAKAICVRSMISAGYAQSWREALSWVGYVIRSPGDDGNELLCRVAPGEGYTQRRLCLG